MAAVPAHDAFKGDGHLTRDDDVKAVAREEGGQARERRLAEARPRVDCQVAALGVPHDALEVVELHGLRLLGKSVIRDEEIEAAGGQRWRCGVRVEAADGRRLGRDHRLR